MGCPEVSTPTPDPWSYQRSQAWEDWPDIQGQTRHGKSLKMAVPETRTRRMQSKALLSTLLRWGRGLPTPPQ